MTSKVLLVTFKAPRKLIEEADKLVEAGVFSSRSEVLRYALSMLIMRYKRSVRARDPENTTQSLKQ